MRYKIDNSGIHGQGSFATQNIPQGEPVGNFTKRGILTDLGRYTNHSFTPNVAPLFDGYGNHKLVALRDIRDGEELLLHYEALATMFRWRQEDLDRLLFWKADPDFREPTPPEPDQIFEQEQEQIAEEHVQRTYPTPEVFGSLAGLYYRIIGGRPVPFSYA